VQCTFPIEQRVSFQVSLSSQLWDTPHPSEKNGEMEELDVEEDAGRNARRPLRDVHRMP